MRKILTVKELIKLLLDHNMDAYVYVNARGILAGLSLPNVCWGGNEDGGGKDTAPEVIFDIQDEERQ